MRDKVAFSSPRKQSNVSEKADNVNFAETSYSDASLANSDKVAVLDVESHSVHVHSHSRHIHRKVTV